MDVNYLIFGPAKQHTQTVYAYIYYNIILLSLYTAAKIYKYNVFHTLSTYIVIHYYTIRRRYRNSSSKNKK